MPGSRRSFRNDAIISSGGRLHHKDVSIVNTEATPLVIDIAKGLITLVREIETNWSKAYLRHSSHQSVSEAKGSYVHQSGVEIIDVLRHKNIFHGIARKGQELLTAVGKAEGVFLLVTDSTFDY